MANPIIEKVVLDWETTAGDDPTTPKPIVLTAVESALTVNRRTNTDNVISGSIDSGGEPYGTYNEVGGNLVSPMYFEQIGVLLKAVLGAPTTAEVGTAWAADTAVSSGDYAIVSTSTSLILKYTSSGTTDATTEPDLSAASVGDTGVDGTANYVVVAKLYSHSFYSFKCIPSFCVQNTLNECSGGSQIVERYNGCKAKSMSITVAPDGDFNITVDTVGMKFRDSITDGISELDEANKITLGQTRIKNAHTSLLIDSASYTLAKNFSLTLDRGTEATYTIGTGANAGQIDDNHINVNGNFSSLFDNGVYTKAKNETEVSFDIQIVDGENKLDFTIAEAKFSFKNEAKRVGEKYPLNLDWTGYKNSGTEKLKAILTNTVASY